MTDTNTDTPVPGMLTEDEFLQHIDATPEMTEDEFLEHFGVKGMKWGQAKGAIQGKIADVKKNNALNKASVAKDRDARDSNIDAARARVKSGDIKSTNKAAKEQFKVDKKEIGSREARKALTAVREKNLSDAATAQMAKSGKETTQALVINGILAAATVLGK